MKGNILLIEESEVLRQSIVFMLTEEGFSVTLGSSLDDLPGLLNQGDFDLLIMDAHSSIGLGLQRLRKVQHQWTSAAVPVIIFHKDLDGAYEISLNESRNIRFIAKPFSKNVLRSVLRELLKRLHEKSAV
ncbi:MAG: response regulator [Spirochaetales bacterium]|nr:response regulator [Spirochaetales bacterium]